MVDYAISGADLFVPASGEHTDSPFDEDDLNPKYFRHLSSLTLDNASHNNADHFQARDLLLFNRWHSNALSATQLNVRGSLFRALAYSAVADHFLEDSIAPGHDLTPRDGMYDPVALSWHDAFNSSGREIGVRNWDELDGKRFDEHGEPIDIDSFIVDFAHKNASRYDQGFQRIGYSQSKQKPRTHLATAIELLRVSGWGSGKPLPACAPRKQLTDLALDSQEPLILQKLNIDWNILNNAASFQDHDSSNDHLSICVHGDGSLDQQHDLEWKDQLGMQKALMLVIEARYIANILTMYIERGHVAAAQLLSDSFTWCPMMRTFNRGPLPGRRKDACSVLLDVAFLHCLDSRADGQCSVTYMLPTAITHYYAFLSSPGGGDLYAAYELRTIDVKDILYSLHVGEISGGNRNPAVSGAEIGQLIDLKTDFDANGFSNNYRQWSSVFAEGYEWYNGKERRPSSAVTLRAMLVAPSLDLAFGIYDKFAFVNLGGTHRVRQAFGLRTDFGFSIISFYLTAGIEPAFDLQNRTYQQLAIGAGVSATINGRRLWNELSAPFRR